MGKSIRMADTPRQMNSSSEYETTGDGSNVTQPEVNMTFAPPVQGPSSTFYSNYQSSHANRTFAPRNVTFNDPASNKTFNPSTVDQTSYDVGQLYPSNPNATFLGQTLAFELEFNGAGVNTNSNNQPEWVHDAVNKLKAPGNEMTLAANESGNRFETPKSSRKRRRLENGTNIFSLNHHMYCVKTQRRIKVNF